MNQRIYKIYLSRTFIKYYGIYDFIMNKKNATANIKPNTPPPKMQ